MCACEEACVRGWILCVPPNSGDIVMAYIGMVCTVMACVPPNSGNIIMAYVGMVYTVMAYVPPNRRVFLCVCV